MNRTYLLTFAMLFLLGSCTSSSTESTDSGGPATGMDASAADLGADGSTQPAPDGPGGSEGGGLIADASPDNPATGGGPDVPQADALGRDGAPSDAPLPDGSTDGLSCTITATAVTPNAGFNLKEQTITITGTCFDGATGVKLIHEDLANEHTLTVQLVNAQLLSAKVPAGIAVGHYTVRVTRGTAVVNLAKGYVATSSIIVAGYDETLFVADISTPKSPVQVVATKLPAGGNWFIRTPRVGYTGTRVYFGEDSGIHGCDILSCSTPKKVLSIPADHDSVASISASRVAADLAFEAHLTGGGAGQNDIYVVKEDGTGLTKILDYSTTPPQIGGETYGTWSVSQPIFSADGQKVVVIWTGHCSSEGGCASDFAHGLLAMNKDGSGKQFLNTAEGEGGDWHLDRTKDGGLVWWREGEPWKMMYLAPSTTTPIAATPPSQGWPDLSWAAYSPIDDAFILQPFNSNDMLLYPLTVSSGTVAVSGTATEIKVPDPANPGEFLGTFAMVHWFGWAGQALVGGGGQTSVDGGGQASSDGGGQASSDGGGQTSSDGGGQTSSDAGGSTTGHACVPTCTKDEDCPSGAGDGFTYSCENGFCFQNWCSSDADCKLAMLPHCIQTSVAKQCMPAGCSSSSECGGEDCQLVFPGYKGCISDKTSCAADNECVQPYFSPGHTQCQAGYCGCVSDSACQAAKEPLIGGTWKCLPLSGSWSHLQ